MVLNKLEGVVEFVVGENFPLINFKETPKDFVYFDFSLDMPTFIICFNNIQPQEIRNYSSEGQLEFKYFTSSDAKYGLFMVKFGSEIQEFPFNPNLCRASVEKYIKNGENAVHIFLVDSATQKLVNLRLVGLTDKIKFELYKQWNVMLDGKLSKSEHMDWYIKLVQKYTTKDLWRMAMPIGKIK